MTNADRIAYEKFLEGVSRAMSVSRAMGVSEVAIENEVAGIIALACRHFDGRDLEWMVKRLQDAAGVSRPIPSIQHEAPLVLQ